MDTTKVADRCDMGCFVVPSCGQYLPKLGRSVVLVIEHLIATCAGDRDDDEGDQRA